MIRKAELRRRIALLEEKVDRLERHQHATLVDDVYWPSGGAFGGDRLTMTPVRLQKPSR